MLEKFQDFFVCCTGTWKTERTYHYLTRREVERSRTEFTVRPLILDVKVKVMADNGRTPPPDLDKMPGFHLAFETVSEKGEFVSQEINLLFVPTTDTSSPILEGDYLRDRAYEEAKPMVAHFCFNSDSRELLMTTHYTRVVSVDSITLVNPTLRLRKIVNYHRPPVGQPLEKVALVGFGVEIKSV
jgi:hypothetical protein